MKEEKLMAAEISLKITNAAVDNLKCFERFLRATRTLDESIKQLRMRGVDNGSSERQG